MIPQFESCVNPLLQQRLAGVSFSVHLQPFFIYESNGWSVVRPQNRGNGLVVSIEVGETR